MKNEIEKFIDACIAQGNAEELGDNKIGDVQIEIIYTIYRMLRDSNRLNELLPLHKHKNTSVCLWASAFTLQISPSKAEKARTRSIFRQNDPSRTEEGKSNI